MREGSKHILITGASGNVGYAVVRGLKEIKSIHRIIVADYNVERARKVLREFDQLEYRKLDLSDPNTFDAALNDVDIVFLLRPPQLADIPKYFEPFIAQMKADKIEKIVFLSVQGAENQKMIPHHKLEKLILDQGLDFVFLRPGYFMQNLTSTLSKDIKESGTIYIPSGNLKLNWVDVMDIGLVAAHILDDFNKYKNKPYEITGNEFVGFEDVATMLREETGRSIIYVSPNLLRFFIHKIKQGVAIPMILVMIMLHWLPRFGKHKARLTGTVQEISGRKPILLREFIRREKDQFQS